MNFFELMIYRSRVRLVLLFVAAISIGLALNIYWLIGLVCLALSEVFRD